MSRAGRNAFNRCANKVVEIVDYGYLQPTETYKNSYINPTSGVATVPIKRITSDSDEMLQFAGNSAILHCPRTEDERVRVESQASNHNGKQAALASLREIAGELVCAHCRFADMNPVDVTIERTKLAHAETERLEAFKHLEAARREIETLFPVAPPLDTEY